MHNKQLPIVSPRSPLTTLTCLVLLPCCMYSGLGLFLVLLASCCQLGYAQNYTALRGGVLMPPLCPGDGTSPPEVLQQLAQKLPQIKQGSRAEQQLQLMSENSRSKMNNLTGSAAEVS